MPQQQLALFAEDATPINELVWFECKNDRVYYLQGGLPIFSHACDDVESFRVIACQLVETGNCTQAQIVRAFGISAISMKRYMKRYRELGISGLMRRVAARKPRVVTAQLARQAGQLLAEGKSLSEVAQELGVKRDTLDKAKRKGRVVATGGKKGS